MTDVFTLNSWMQIESTVSAIRASPPVESLYIMDTLPPGGTAAIQGDGFELGPTVTAQNDAVLFWDALAELAARSPMLREISLRLYWFAPFLYDKVLQAVQGPVHRLRLSIDPHEEITLDDDIPETPVLEEFIVQKHVARIELVLPWQGMVLVSTALRNALPNTTDLQYIDIHESDFTGAAIFAICTGMEHNTSVTNIQFRDNMPTTDMIRRTNVIIENNRWRPIIESIRSDAFHNAVLPLRDCSDTVVTGVLRALGTNTHVREIRCNVLNHPVPPEFANNRSVIRLDCPLTNDYSRDLAALIAANRRRPWTPQTHHQFDPDTRKRIVTGELALARLHTDGKVNRLPPEIRGMIWSFFTPGNN